MKEELTLEEKKAAFEQRQKRTEQQARLVQLRIEREDWQTRLSSLQSTDLLVSPAQGEQLRTCNARMLEINRAIRALEQIVDGA